jgi:hypothetical protein
MDQGVTRSLKCHYHKLVFLKIIECIGKRQNRAITLLDEIRCIEKAGRRVKDRTIRNYFRYAGILTAQGVDVSDSEDAVAGQIATAAADDDLPLSKRVQKLVVMFRGHYDYDACAIIDGDIVRTEEHTDEDTVSKVRNKNGKFDPEEGGGGEGGNKEEPERGKKNSGASSQCE